FGKSSIKQSFSITVLTLTQLSSANGEIVGFFNAGSSVSSFCRFAFLTLTNMWILFEPSTTPLSNANMSWIFSRFSGSSIAFLLAIRTAEDLRTVSMIFKPFASIVVPVSVTSIMASEFSGGFASVAPKDRKILAFGLSPFFHQGVTSIGSAAPKRFLYWGVLFRYSEAMLRYSVLIRKFLSWLQMDSMNSPIVAFSQVFGTAITSLIFPYSKFCRTSTSARFSFTQSSPVMPRSCKPSLTKTGISWGLRTLSSIWGSFMLGRYVRSVPPILKPDLEKNSAVAFSKEPFGMVNFILSIIFNLNFQRNL